MEITLISFIYYFHFLLNKKKQIIKLFRASRKSMTSMYERRVLHTDVGKKYSLLQNKGEKEKKSKELEIELEKQEVITCKRPISYFSPLYLKFHKISVSPHPIIKISLKRIRTLYYNYIPSSIFRI